MLTLYKSIRSGVFNYSNFENAIKENYNLLLSSGLRRTDSYGHFFENLLVLHNKHLISLSEDVCCEFAQLAKQQIIYKSNVQWLTLPRFYNKMGEFYTLLFTNYIKGFYHHFATQVANESNINLKLTFLHEFYEEAELVLDELNNVGYEFGDQRFAYHIQALTLFNLYHQITIAFPDLHPNNQLTEYELAYKLGVDQTVYIEEQQVLVDAIEMYLSTINLTETFEHYELGQKDGSQKQPKGETVTELGYLTIADAARFLQISVNTFSNYRKMYKIEEHAIGGKKMFMRDDLLKILEKW